MLLLCRRHRRRVLDFSAGITSSRAGPSHRVPSIPSPKFGGGDVRLIYYARSMLHTHYGLHYPPESQDRARRDPIARVYAVPLAARAESAETKVLTSSESKHRDTGLVVRTRPKLLHCS